jgi:hypothetical protein
MNVSFQDQIMFSGNVPRALLFFFSVCCMQGMAQPGGKNSFEFLNVPASARMGGLGGVNTSLADRDVNFYQNNPSLNGDTLSGVASASYQFYVADVGHASFAYANKFKKVGIVTMGVQHMNYGTIKGYDATGSATSDFHASETVIAVSKSHQIGNYRLGATLKGIFSGIAGYNANALALDFGGLFKHPRQQLTIGISVRNLGVVISDYTGKKESKLPFDVMLGTTFKPQHMPLRFSITAFNLIKTNLVYSDAAAGDSSPSSLQRIFSHVNFGGEVLVHKNVNVLIGYNYLNHQALKLRNSGGGAGLSFGFSATVKNYDFVFSRMAYVAGKAAWSFTLSGNINKLFKRH